MVLTATYNNPGAGGWGQSMFGYIANVVADKGRQVYAIEPSATVAEAVRLMNERGVGALVVLDGGRLAGIFTERDVLRRVVDAGRAPRDTRVAAVMTTDVATVAPETSVQAAMEIMTARRFHHLPVVEQGEVVALVSIGDLLRRVTLHQQEHIERMAEYITGGGVNV